MRIVTTRQLVVVLGHLLCQARLLQNLSHLWIIHLIAPSRITSLYAIALASGNSILASAISHTGSKM
jgi:hypothetical protein